MTRLSLLILLMLCPIAVAAPPTITHLFPAGGQRGTKVSVTAVGTFSWPVQVWASDKGITVTPGKQKGELTIAIVADVAPGVHWLRAHDKEGGGNLRPFIVGTLPEVVEKEPNDEPTQAQQFKGPVVVNGRLEKRGDVDCFAVEAKEGQTLVASLKANHTLKSPMDAILQVLSATGGVLEQNHDFHGLDPQVMFPVPKNGTYFVRVFAFPELPDGTIGFAGAANYVYRLTITTGGFADHALPLAVSRSTPGNVRLVGWNLPKSARVLPVPKDGVLTAPDVVDPALVRLEPHATYDDTEPGSEFTEPLATPFTVTGRLANRESVAGYRFLGKKGQPLTFQAESQALGFPLVPVLRILDAGGKQLARAEATPPNDIELSFTPPADGAYRVEVRDLYDEGSVRHLFRLRVIRPEPDFALTVADDRFTLAPGKPLDILVTVMRRNGFAGAVDVSAENLPAGGDGEDGQ